MLNLRNDQKMLIKMMLLLGVMCIVILNHSYAQAETATPRSNVYQYLVDKYQTIKQVTSRIQITPDGPLGSISIVGTISVKNKRAAEGDKTNRARAIATCFLEEEAEMFGITDMAEIKEFNASSRQGKDGEYVNIHYERHVNRVPLKDTHISISIAPDETIYGVGAELEPVPAALYEATASGSAIKAAKVREVVEQDMNSRGVESSDVRISYLEKLATWKKPYVIWKARAGSKKGRSVVRQYLIDAFTGQILENTNALER